MLGRPLKYGLGHCGLAAGRLGAGAANREAGSGFNAFAFFRREPPVATGADGLTDQAQGSATLLNGRCGMAGTLGTVENAGFPRLRMSHLDPVPASGIRFRLEDGFGDVLVPCDLAEPAAQRGFGYNAAVVCVRRTLTKNYKILKHELWICLPV